MAPKQHTLPIVKKLPEILGAVQQHQVVVIESPTGSGKTTQIPQALFKSNIIKNGIIGITQPRRIAAISIAAYLKQQLQTDADSVGYKIRFDDTTTPKTTIKVMTDGTLLQEMKHDALLADYDVMMIDEAHERSLNIDFILGLLKRIIKIRKDLRLIISSATINSALFVKYFPRAHFLPIDAPSYPVKKIYRPLDNTYDKEEMIDAVCSIIYEQVQRPDYDSQVALVFLSGEVLIRDTIYRLEQSPHAEKLFALPLFGRLSSEEQDRVFDAPPANRMKVVVATNIAETSITIDGVSVVVDSGRAKIVNFLPKARALSLDDSTISKASADQRCGRAGRTRPGTCYRLYSEQEYDERQQYTLEEIFRTDLSEVVFRMAELGIRYFERFEFISSPSRQSIHQAVASLQRLDILNSDGALTPLGKQLAPFPLYPRHARILVEAINRYPQVLAESIGVVSFLTTSSPFAAVGKELLEEARAAQRKLATKEGDFNAFLKLLREYQVTKDKSQYCTQNFLDKKAMDEIVNIHTQLSEIVSEQNIPILSGGPQSQLIASICSGLVDMICVRHHHTRYSSVTLRNIMIHPGSLLFGSYPDCIVASEIVKTTQTLARSAAVVNIDWLDNLPTETVKKLRSLAHNRNKRSRGDRSEQRHHSGRSSERTGGRYGKQRSEQHGRKQRFSHSSPGQRRGSTSPSVDSNGSGSAKRSRHTSTHGNGTGAQKGASNNRSTKRSHRSATQRKGATSPSEDSNGGDSAKRTRRSAGGYRRRRR